MNKDQAVRKLSYRTGYPQCRVKAILDALEELVGEELSSGEKVTLTGFGSFFIREWGGWTSRQTGKPVPFRRTIRFSPGTRLKRTAGAGKVDKMDT